MSSVCRKAYRCRILALLLHEDVSFSLIHYLLYVLVKKNLENNVTVLFTAECFRHKPSGGFISRAANKRPFPADAADGISHKCTSARADRWHGLFLAEYFQLKVRRSTSLWLQHCVYFTAKTVRGKLNDVELTWSLQEQNGKCFIKLSSGWYMHLYELYIYNVWSFFFIPKHKPCFH